MAKYTPPLNTTALYSARAPWPVSTDQVYTSVAIRAFVDLIDQGVDIFETYYEPLELTAEQYEADRAEGANLITLKSATLPTVYVPDTWLEGYPSLDRVLYNHVVLSISFGAVADTTPLDFVKEQLANVASDVLGVTPEVLEHISPTTGVITQEQHELLEQGRQAAITMRDSDYAKLVQAQAELVALREQYDFLLEWAEQQPGFSA